MNQPQGEARVIAALYAYAATTHNNEDAIPSQAEHMREFCEDNGITPGEVYTDQNGSREAFNRMMADGTRESPPFQKVLVYDVSRFSRSIAKMTECVARLKANGVQVVAVTDGPIEPLFGESLKELSDDQQTKQTSDQTNSMHTW